MNWTDSFASQLLWHLPSLALLLSLYGAMVVGAKIQARRGKAQRNSLVGLFSNLHAFNRNLGPSSDPRKMAEGALAGTLKTLGTKRGLVLLEAEGEASLSHMSSYGLSASAARELSAKAMRTYLALAAKRWGNLLTVTDLEAEELQSYPFGPQFREFVGL